jgi:hypothetical protein
LAPGEEHHRKMMMLVALAQGDQIGRIFALCNAFLLWHVFKITFCISFFATFSTKTFVNLEILTKYGLGYI